MLKDPDLAPLVEQQEVQVWVGPGRHIVSYNIVSSDTHNQKRILRSKRSKGR